jgi:hypothetical protein
MGRCRAKEAAMVAPKFTIPLADLQKKQKEIVTKVGYKSGIGTYDPTFKGDPLLNPTPNPAPIQERLLQEVRKIIASLPGAVLIGKATGVKAFDSASGKVAREYGDDWSQMKDLNRCTVVVLQPQDMKTAWNLVKSHFSATDKNNRSGFEFFLEKTAEADTDACGYSGYTVFVRTPGSDPKIAEIQINYPPMMYAKSVDEFRQTMADREAKMKADFPALPGGLGHKIYDLHKKYKGTGFKTALEATSKLYYDYFRSDRNLALGQQALAAVRNLNQEAVPYLTQQNIADHITNLLPPAAGPPPKAPSWMAESRRVWTQRRT